jgi:hypothetical protein
MDTSNSPPFSGRIDPVCCKSGALRLEVS